jgi:hypothetical protein
MLRPAPDIFKAPTVFWSRQAVGAASRRDRAGREARVAHLARGGCPRLREVRGGRGPPSLSEQRLPAKECAASRVCRSYALRAPRARPATSWLRAFRWAILHAFGLT